VRYIILRDPHGEADVAEAPDGVWDPCPLAALVSGLERIKPVLQLNTNGVFAIEARRFKTYFEDIQYVDL
jgi:hypothetical protein